MKMLCIIGLLLVAVAGGKPSKGTPADKRLKKNKPATPPVTKPTPPPAKKPFPGAAPPFKKGQ